MYLWIHFLFWSFVHLTRGHNYFEYFDGQISGADYCTKLSACRNFVVFKCKECGTSVDKIEIENKLLLMSREPQDVKFTVTCYSNTKRLCNPLNTTWLEVEFIWFQHCDEEAANRTKRFVPGCGVVGPGGWMHGLNRPAPPMPFFGEPMLPHPPMRPSPCQQTPPGCRGGRCGGDRGRGPPPPRPCHMGGPCGGRPPPRPCGMGGPCDRGRGRPPPRPCAMGGPCDRGRPPPRPCHMGGPCVGRPPPPIPCSMGGPCDNNFSPTRTPPYDGYRITPTRRPQPTRPRPQPPGPRQSPRPGPRPPSPISTTIRNKVTPYTTRRTTSTTRWPTRGVRTNPSTTRSNKLRVSSTSQWTTTRAPRLWGTLPTTRPTRQPTSITTTVRIVTPRVRLSFQPWTTKSRVQPTPTTTRWPPGTRRLSTAPPWVGRPPIKRRVTTSRAPNPEKPRPTIGQKRWTAPPWQKVSSTSPKPGINPPDRERPFELRSTTSSVPPWGRSHGPVEQPGPPWREVLLTSLKPGINPSDRERPFELRSTTLNVPPWGRSHGPVEQPGLPWREVLLTSPKPGINPSDRERPFELRSTTLNVPPWGRSHGPVEQPGPPWREVPSTSPKPGINPPDRERPFELRSTTSSVPPWGRSHGPVEQPGPPWQKVPSTSSQPGMNPSDEENPFESKSTMTVPPWQQTFGPGGEPVPPWWEISTLSPVRLNSPDLEHPLEPRSTTSGIPGLSISRQSSHFPGEAVRPWQVHGPSTQAQPGLKPSVWELDLHITTSKAHGRLIPQEPREDTGFEKVSTTQAPNGAYGSVPPWYGVSIATGFPSPGKLVTPQIQPVGPGETPEQVQFPKAGLGEETSNSSSAGSFSNPQYNPDDSLVSKLSKYEIFRGIEYRSGMKSSIFINQIAERCKTLVHKKPPDIQTAKLKNKNHVDEALLFKQLQLRRQKQEMWCAFVKDILVQRKECQIDRSMCKKVTETLPGGIKMNIWVKNDNRVQNNPKITDNSMNININSNNNGQPFSSGQIGKNTQHEELLLRLEEIQTQQKQIQQKILEQEKQRNTKVDTVIHQNDKSDNLTIQRNILASRSRTQLISEAKSKLQILITIVKGLKKEVQVMTEKKSEYATKMKNTGQNEASVKIECESVIDYVSESDMEHHKMIIEFETLIEILNSTMVDLEIHHETSGGQQIGQQTFSTFVYYLQEASNTIKLFNQNHQLIHNNAENHMKNSNAKNIVHNIYQFVYVKGKADCDECLKSAKSSH